MSQNTIIITEQGTRLTKKGHALVLFKQREKIFIYPMANMERIIIMGRVELSTALVGLLLNKSIEVIFLTVDGRYRGRLIGATTKNVFIRQQQYNNIASRDFKLQVSREFVRGKVKNYARMIQKNHNIKYSIFEGRLKNMIKSLDAANSMHQIRGLEGSFSALYYRYFPSMLKYKLGFKKRIKHPPPDPVNILLSFGYTLLFNNTYAFVEAAGLDPYAGVLHELKYGHPALVSDLIEQFRAPIVDTLVISMINHSRITEKNFEQNSKCEFNKEGIGKFVDAYQQKVQRKFTYKNRKYNYLQIIEEQVRKFVRLLEGKNEHYHNFEYR